MKVFTSNKVEILQELNEGGAKEIPLKEAPPSMCKEHDEQLNINCFDLQLPHLSRLYHL